jgi:hypothetical protein
MPTDSDMEQLERKAGVAEERKTLILGTARSFLAHVGHHVHTGTLTNNLTLVVYISHGAWKP